MKAWESELADDYSAMTRKWKELAHPHTILQLGTLGTGNHFIEVCIQIDGPAPDADDPRIWVMLHSVHFGRPGLLTRKGTVNAEKGVMGIIPGSMGAHSYITRGLGQSDSLNTSSHGAGRVMSRNAARKAITLEQHLASLSGIECRTDADVTDESPAAYKDIGNVMAAQADLTEPIHTLKQIVVVKG